MISELTKEIVSLIKSKEDRVRTRTEIEQGHFTCSVRHILTELWKAYYEQFRNDIPVKQEVMFERERANDDPPKSLDIQEILDGEVEYSLWQDRDRFWWKEKSQKSTGSK